MRQMAEHDTIETAEELYEGAPCGYLSSAPDGTILRVNRTFLLWTGYRRDELLHRKRFVDLLTLGGKVYYETHVQPLLRMQGAVNQIQLELTCADGHPLPILLNTIQHQDAAGQPDLLRSTLFDITDRKRYERELLTARRSAELRARQAALAADIGRALTRRVEPSAQLQLCAEALVQYLDALEVRIWTTPDGKGELRLQGWAGVLSSQPGFRPARPPARELGAASQHRAIILNGVAEILPGEDEEWLQREGAASSAAFPLIVDDRALGILAVYHREPLSTENQEALATTSNELAVALHRFRAERQRDELLERLRESRELLETTLRSIGDAVITTDSQARITFMNAVAEELTGWTLREAVARPLREAFAIVNENTRADVENPVEKALRAGTVVGLANHTVLVRRDGSEISIDDSAAPIRGPSGEVMGVVLVFRDVTSQREAERELRTTEERLSTVVRNAPLILFSLDAEGRILVSQGKGLSALGIEDPSSRIGLSVFDAYAHVPWLTQEFRRALAGEEFVGGGELLGVSYETHFTPTFNETGAVSGTVGLALDVTARRRYEETIRKTVEFEQQLLGIVSHDLRNPISSILLGASVLLRKGDALDDGTLRIAARIQSSGERAQRLIRDLLDFTQARLGGGIPIQRAPMDLAQVVRQAIEEVETGHPDRSVRLDARGNFHGEWDADRLSQVAVNLLVNALKYSPPETAVQVRLQEHGSTISFSVHNEGTPIPEESLGTLFLPMRRATSAGDKSGRSIGLGLFIVKQIVQAHRGEVQVHSDSAAGTTFRVILPR